MTAGIPESHLDLIEGPVLATLATLMPDGQPQLSVVWCGTDGTHLMVSMTRERQKAKNIANDPRITLLARDPGDPYRYIEIRGTAVEMTREGAVEYINQLAQLYEKQTFYGGFASAERLKTETRITCKIRPTRIRTEG